MPMMEIPAHERSKCKCKHEAISHEWSTFSLLEKSSTSRCTARSCTCVQYTKTDLLEACKTPDSCEKSHTMGWRWGWKNATYRTREGAEKQRRAIFASGYRGR